MIDQDKHTMEEEQNPEGFLTAPEDTSAGAESLGQDQLQQQLDDARDQLLRAFAEMENIRKRAQKEREEAQKFGISRFGRDLLSVADNLRRALTSVPDLDHASDDLKTVVQGVSMIEQELMSAFQKAHIVPMTALHQKFDAAFHQAVVELETEEHAPGTVVQVIQEGYQLHDRLLRPALVAVAKAPARPADNGA